MELQLRPPCSPDLTKFRHTSPCHRKQQRSWPSKRTTNNRSTQKMLTAVMVDSQMANCNRFGYQQAIPHSSFIASTSISTCLCRLERKTFQVAWLNHPKSVQVCQDRCINGLDQEKPVIPRVKGILDKKCVLRSTFQGLLKHESTGLQPVKSKLPVQTFLPCSRKRGLFGHVVTKSREA